MLIIFYDGNCPLCSAEMSHLKKHDENNNIKLVNLHSKNFSKLYPSINIHRAMQILHGTYQGHFLLGLEVTHRAWTLVGKGFWVAPLNWPILKTLSHWVYLLIAKYRHPISSAIAKVFKLESAVCQSGACFEKSTNANHRRK
ncbi:thiol-disulfide oxidoreductase DCC family protein [Thalassotalea atypica]|uniref:thiol-disulfide oxidoreductase DCC family protein n=1 Tax=Thalassotalea atypica TaxID=2054316 RepID=UPI002573CEEC|nr:DUF393 domain-containing protein [Thalassotalea atypica]